MPDKESDFLASQEFNPESDAPSVVAPDRRKTEITENFPNDGFPSEEDLVVDIGDIRKAPNDFFKSRGPLFTACWLLNNLKQPPKIDYADKPLDGRGAEAALDDDLRDLLTRVFKENFGYTRRSEDVDKYLRQAKAWYGER